MPVLTPFAVGKAAREAGWEQSKVAWVIAVTFAESSWNTDAVGGPNSRGEKWYGLGQVSDVHKDKFQDFFPPSNRWKDPKSNLAAMRILYEEQGEGAWAPSDNSRRAGIMGQAQLAAAQVQAAVDGPISVQGQSVLDKNLQEGLFGVALAAKVLGIPVSADANYDANGNLNTTVTTPVDWVTNNFTTILWVGGGALLVILGALLLAKTEIPNVAGVVGKALS